MESANPTANSMEHSGQGNASMIQSCDLTEQLRLCTARRRSLLAFHTTILLPHYDRTTTVLRFHQGIASAAVEARALAILKKHCRVDWSGDHGERIRVGPKVPPSVGGPLVGSCALDRRPLASSDGPLVRRGRRRPQA